MPTIDDYSDDDEQDQGVSAGGSSGGGGFGGGGARQATPSKQNEPEFVPWSRFVSANQDVSKRGANQLNSQVQGEIGNAQSGLKGAQQGFNAGVESNYDQHRAGDIPVESRPTFQWGGAVGEFGKAPQQAKGTMAGGAFGAKNDGSTLNPGPPQQAAPQPVYGQTSVYPQFDAPGQKNGTLSWGADPKGAAQAPALRTLSESAIKNGPKGAKDLESSLGHDAWAKLLGDTTKAQGDANALGSETGVQGLIQQQAQQPLAQNGAFDAALINGQGRKQFADTSKSGSGLVKSLGDANGSAQHAWHSLIGDITEQRRQRNAQAQADAFNNRPKDAPPGAPAAEAPPGEWHPGDYTDLRSFMDEGSPGQYAHETAMDASPSDWITRGLGEAGIYNGDNASQEFAKNYGANGNKDNTWQIGNLRAAARLVQSQLGEKAVEYWFKHLTPEMWNSYLGFGNAGAMAREMRAWLSSLPADVKKQLGI